MSSLGDTQRYCSAGSDAHQNRTRDEQVGIFSQHRSMSSSILFLFAIFTFDKKVKPTE